MHFHFFQVPEGVALPRASLVSCFGMHTAIAILLPPLQDAAVRLPLRVPVALLLKLKSASSLKTPEVYKRHPLPQE